MADNSIHKDRINFGLEIAMTYGGLGVTIIASFFLIREVADMFLDRVSEGSVWGGAEQSLFAAIVCFLIYGNVVYQVTRIGYLRRLKDHQPAPRAELNRIYDRPAPALTFLIPSYKEEARVVRQALLSAALQEYPRRRVVLLIDDPPNPTDSEDLSGLTEARRLPRDVQGLLEGQADRLDAALSDFLARKGKGYCLRDEYRRVAAHYREVAQWFSGQAEQYTVTDHTDAWFVKKVLLGPAASHLRYAEELESRAAGTPDSLDEATLLREYRRLATLFKVEVTGFERKRYENLSHEPNKAMNLNSYIGLLGKSFRTVQRNGLLHLEEDHGDHATYSVPPADYLITLDADSLLLPEYALRLIHIMETPGNERLAVVQTPYNAVPYAPGLVERVAGATTDIQYIIHQGFTHHRATFWVGANALLRKAALDDIRALDVERGFIVHRYIQDRTVIEDTESSIDLVDRGWSLYNYPDRLSYSATPPDFGSLLIQRRRWANGGLIIVPKFLKYLFGRARLRRRLREGFMRFHYLTSITGVNIGLVIILAYPFEDNLRSLWLPLTAVPYYFLYGRDLVQSGYRLTDLLRVYALNLLLVPVNLGGVFKSLHQAWTGEKIPFSRTPKVMGRTAAPVLYTSLEFAILLYCLSGTIVDAVNGRWLHALFAVMNAAFFSYAIIRFVGLKEAREDLLCAWDASRMRSVLSSAPGRVVEWAKSEALILGLTFVAVLMLIQNLSATSAW